MSLSAVDSYRTFTAEPKLRSESSRHAAERRDESDPKPYPGAREGRPQRLERALVSALESLKLNAPVASTGFQAPSTGAATDTTASTEPVTTTPAASEDSIKQAVHEFAHALAQALRGDEHSERGGRGRYAEMSQGLERLSQSVGAASVSAAPGIVAGEQPGPIKPAVDTSTIKNAATPSDTREPEIMPIKVDNPTIENPILVTQPLDATATTETAATATSATSTTATATAISAPAKEDRLLSAFKHLFNALQPATASTAASAGGAAVDYSAKLRDFLHTLGQALSPHGDSAMPTSGGLLNVTA